MNACTFLSLIIALCSYLNNYVNLIIISDQMIQAYIANLEIRLLAIDSCIGGIENYQQKQVIQVKNKTQEFLSKLHKDVQKKFQKVRRIVQKYGDLIDTATTPKDKLNIIIEQLDQLKDFQGHLAIIQKHLPALKTDEYVKIRSQRQNLAVLQSASEISLSNQGKIQIIKYDNKSIEQLRNDHRSEMNQILQLNKRIVQNLNSKIERLIRNKNTK